MRNEQEKRRTGSGASLYNAYGDKEKLFLAAYAQYGERLLSEVRSALDKSSPERALRDFFDFTIRSMATGTPTRGCLTAKAATDESAHSDLIQAALKAFLEDFENTRQGPAVARGCSLTPRPLPCWRRPACRDVDTGYRGN